MDQDEKTDGLHAPRRFQVLGVGISAVNCRVAGDILDRWIRSRARVYVCVAPVATVMDCQDDPAYREAVAGAAMVTPDGMPLVWLGRRQGFPEVDRAYGPDLMRMMCARPGIRHYFLGGTPETLVQLTVYLRRTCPGIVIAGQESPPFRPLTEKETAAQMARIQAAEPDILWVGLGSPKQDVWMARHRPRLDVPVMIGVGAAFDFLAGTKRQAPRWIQRSGLEWLFRLACEPRRLWRRYLIGNTRFVWLLWRERFHKSKGPVL